ncbi:uncharacterized protein LOC110829403 [Zootermopsis nevadensis]|uniref:DUF4797 domain-containing protein n=1 Tax=Zootermopsis nevadensis TaxID=136037 RepID=A0A067RKK3_ZOONE|nr:uncharacterized protein LOC110829403 [Zootermopsis nevadensis]KDR20015.1 hypothetical protein L798_05250 [Zootermopsis nevadensis]
MEQETSRKADTSIVFVSLNPPSLGSPRSVSPMSSSPTRDLRGIGLFRAIGRHLRHPRHFRDNEEDDNTSQSTDSEERSCGSAGSRNSRSKKYPSGKKGRFVHRSASSDLSHQNSTGNSGESSSGSDTSSGHVPRHNVTSSPSSSLRQRSSFKEVFQSLTISSRSHSASCASPRLSNTDTVRLASGTNASGEKKKKKKSILRPPVTYTYVRGLSGLPTQRVPKGYRCFYLPSVACCGSSKFGNHHHFPGLNR